MLKTLRGRFIIAQILPLLIVIPLMGMATVYLLEQKILIPSLLAELKGSALLLSRLAAQSPDIWEEPGYAQQLLTQGSYRKEGRLMLLGRDRTLLASSEPSDANRIGDQIDLPGMDAALQGQVDAQLRFSTALEDDIADALTPVIGADGEVLGFVRLSYHYYTFADQIYQMRYLLISILGIALVVGIGLGIGLAINVSAPVAKVTQAIYALANGERSEALPESGAEETRRLARSVNVLKERLQNLEIARKRLLANLVHEIGRPLGALRMGIEALSHGAQHDENFYTELLTGMDQETARLQHLLENLAQMYEQALGALELERQPLNLATWLPETLIPWQQAALQKHLYWEMEIQENLPEIRADALRLAQIIGNLVSNAIKFTPPGGSVSISSGSNAQEIWIKVSDTGPGIPVAQQEEIFIPFIRGEQGKRFPQGMGLGLSIARDLVEAHGGRLSLESQTGLGAKFTIWLPLHSHT